jgi:Tfp pilus assembly protein PilF/4-amino-4-deoxy-L-arabinose transferase-like glycosyltransferase
MTAPANDPEEAAAGPGSFSDRRMRLTPSAGSRAGSRTSPGPPTGPRSPAGFRAESIFIPAVVLLALALRLIFQWEIQDHPLSRQLFLDPAFYDSWARSIAAGDWLSRSQGLFYGNPLYPYFLAIIYAIFGRSLVTVKVIQSLLGTATCLMLILIGRRIFGRTAGLLAGLMAALYAPFIFYEGTLTIATVGLFLTVLTVLWLVSTDPPAYRSALAAGLTWGLRALARFDATILACVGWLLGFPGTGSRGRRIVLALIFMAGTAAVILPVTARNRIVGGRWTAITAHGGETFYGGNNPRAGGIYTPAPGVRPGTAYEHEDFRRLAERRLGKELTLAESSSYWFGQAVDYIRSHPREWIRLEMRKLWLFCQPREIPDNRNIHFFRRYSGILRLPLVTFAVIGPLALLGMIAALRIWRRTLLLYLQVILSTLSVLLFFVSSRYRLPTVPFLILFAAYGLSWSWKTIRARRWIRAAAAWLPVLGLLMLAGRQAAGLKEGPFLSRQETLGVALIRQGRVDEGIAQLEKVRELDPDRITARFNLGVAYLEEKDRPRLAAREFRHLIGVMEDYPKAHYMLAQAYYVMGNYEEALREIRKEASAEEGAEGHLLELEAMILVRLKRYQQAERIFREILESDPGSAGAARSLGNVLYLQKDVAGALKAWQRALELNPEDEQLQEDVDRLRSLVEKSGPAE